jgi:hypothetical protein
VKRIVFLARGHGFGHAARDLRLVEAIRRARPDVELVLASSGSGLEYFRRRSVSCVDLGIDDEHDMSEAAGQAVWDFLTTVDAPDLVLADEVVWALPICRQVLGVPCVLVTDWFYAEIGQPGHDHVLNQATEIVVVDFPQAHPNIADITAPVLFTGPLVDSFEPDRAALRRELGVADDAFAAVVTLGGMPDRPEARAIADLAVQSWAARAGAQDRLFVLADQRATDGGPASWTGVTSVPERYFRAADAVVVEAAGFTVCELARNRIPTVAVMVPLLSAAARLRVKMLESAGLLVTVPADATPDQMWTAMRAVPSTTSTVEWADADAVAAHCLRHIA